MTVGTISSGEGGACNIIPDAVNLQVRLGEMD